MASPRKQRRCRVLTFESLCKREMLAADLQNPGNPLDVNDDLSISPIDALVVINRLSAGAPNIPAESSGNSPYVDVNGDGFISPIDALVVINRLNAPKPEIAFRLVNDTDRDGGSARDRKTFDLSVQGRLNFGDTRSKLFVGMGLGDDIVWTNVNSQLRSNGNFDIDDATLRLLIGDRIERGPTQLRFRHDLSSGNETAMDIELFAAPPIPRLVGADILEDSQVVFDLLGNTYAPDSRLESLILEIVEQPKAGVLVPSGRSVAYTPIADFFGSDSFVYKVISDDAQSDLTTLSIEVQPVNDPPRMVTVPNQQASVVDGSIEIPFSAIDVDGDAIEYFGFATVPNPLAEIRDKYGLVDAGPDYVDLTGLGEKWLFGKEGTTFFLLPSGDLVQWRETFAATGTRESLIARLDPAIYEDPALLFDAAQAVLAPASVLIDDEKLTVVPASGLYGELTVTVIVADEELYAMQSFQVTIDPTYDSNESERTAVADLISQAAELSYDNTEAYIALLESLMPTVNETAAEDLESVLEQLTSLHSDAQESIAESENYSKVISEQNTRQLAKFDAITAKLKELRTQYETEWNDYQSRLDPKLVIDETIPPIFIFGRDYPDKIQVYRGETLEVDFRAVHPVKSTRYSWEWDDSKNLGDLRLDVQFGKFTWRTPEYASGVYDFSVSAIVDDYRRSRIDFQVEILPNEPVIESLTITPLTISDKGTDPITLKANNAFHPRLRVDGINYYQDADGDGVLNESIDWLLGSGGGSWTGYPHAVPSGNSATFFAKAYSYTFSARLESKAVRVTADVLETPDLNLSLLSLSSSDAGLGTFAGHPISNDHVARYGAGSSALVSVDYGQGATFVQRYTNIDATGIGAPVGDRVKIGDFTTQQFAARADADGNVTIVFANGNFGGLNPDGSDGSGIWMVRVNAQNQLIGQLTTIATIQDNEGFVFTFDMNDSGMGFLAWKGYYVAPVVYLQTFALGGAQRGEVQELAYNGGFNDGGVWTSSAINPAGHFGVYWPGHFATGSVADDASVRVQPLSMHLSHVAINSIGWAVAASNQSLLVIDPLGRPAGQPVPLFEGFTQLIRGIAFTDDSELRLLSQKSVSGSNSRYELIERRYKLGLQDGLQTESLLVTNPSTLEAGKKIEILHAIANVKTHASEPIDVVFYLSRDQVVDLSDRLLGTVRTSSGIEAGSRMEFAASLSLPPDVDPFWMGGSTSLYLVAAIPAAGQQFATLIASIAVDLPDPISRTGDSTTPVIHPAPPAQETKYIRPEVVEQQVYTDEFNRSIHFIELIGYQFLSAAYQLLRDAPAEIADPIRELTRKIEFSLDTFVESEFRKEVLQIELDRAATVRDEAVALASATYVSNLANAKSVQDKIVNTNQAKIRAEQATRASRVAKETERLQNELKKKVDALDAATKAQAQTNAIRQSLFQGVGFLLVGDGESAHVSAQRGINLKKVVSSALPASPLSQPAKCLRNPVGCAETQVQEIVGTATTIKDAVVKNLPAKIESLLKSITSVPARIDKLIADTIRPAQEKIGAAHKAFKTLEAKFITKQNSEIQNAKDLYDKTVASIPPLDKQILDATEQIVIPNLSSVGDSLGAIIGSIDSPEGFVEQIKKDLTTVDEQNPFGSVQDIADTTKVAADIVKEALDQLIEKLEPAIEELKESGDSFSDWAKETGGKISDWTKQTGEDIAEWGKETREEIEAQLEAIKGGSEYYWEKIIGAEAVAYEYTTPGTLSLGYLNGGYYIDINHPGGGKFDTATVQNAVSGDFTIPSVNFVEFIPAALTGGQVTTEKTSEYYDIREKLRTTFDTPVYFASERLVEWLSAEAQTSAILYSVFVNPDQWVNEASRHGGLEFGRFNSWLSVHNIGWDILFADALKQPQTAAVLLAPILTSMEPTLGALFSAEMVTWMSRRITPRGTELSDPQWAQKNPLLVRDPTELYTDAYMRGLAEERPQGRDTDNLHDAMLELFAKPLAADDELLDRIADLRGRSHAEFRSEYQKFKLVYEQRDKAVGGEVESVEGLIKANEYFAASTSQLRYGTIIGAAFGIDAVFGAALNPTGGLVGPGNVAWDSGGHVLSSHGIVHDAAGYLYNYHQTGPGYNYLGLENDIATSDPLAGQRSGIAYWSQVCDKGYPLRVMLNPGGPVNYHYDFTTTPVFGSKDVGSTDLSHVSFGLTYTGRDTVPGILDPYRTVFTRDGFDLEELRDPRSLTRDYLGSATGTAISTALKGAFTASKYSFDFDAAEGFDNSVFADISAWFGLTNEDILAQLPDTDTRAPAVVSLMENAVIMERAQSFLERISYGNEASAVIDRLEFDISTFELNIEFRISNRQSWGKVSELANSLVNDTDLSWDEVVRLLRVLSD